MCEKVSREISFGNDKGKSRVGFSSRMTKKAKVEYKLRLRPTFAFFVISEGNPKPRAQI